MLGDDAVIREVFGVPVTLLPAEGVFMPSEHGLFYTRSIPIRPGERVIDIGTGSGVFAIAAATRGAQVVATDVDPRAVAAAARNAERNETKIMCREGPFFAGAEGPFDVILANLPNEIVAPEYLAGLPPADARAFDGGAAGNEQLLALLDAAPPHMHAASRLYLGVHALTDYHGTLRAALRRYAARLIDFEALPVKSFVTEHLAFYEALNKAGVIHIFQGGAGRWFSFGYIYELTLKPGTDEAA